MPTQILSTGTTAADSADVVVADGETLTVGLKGAADTKARVLIFLKDDGGGYNGVGELSAVRPATVIAAPGTFRFTRIAGAACGVFSG